MRLVELLQFEIAAEDAFKDWTTIENYFQTKFGLEKCDVEDVRKSTFNTKQVKTCFLAVTVGDRLTYLPSTPF